MEQGWRVGAICTRIWRIYADPRGSSRRHTIHEVDSRSTWTPRSPSTSLLESFRGLIREDPRRIRQIRVQSCSHSIRATVLSVGQRCQQKKADVCNRIGTLTTERNSSHSPRSPHSTINRFLPDSAVHRRYSRFARLTARSTAPTLSPSIPARISIDTHPSYWIASNALAASP